MCGFCGFIDINLEDKQTVLSQMMEKIVHRGPDSSGEFIDENVGLGFRRLSIIDLADGAQPLYNEDESLVLTFNGEIYNYQGIRKFLIDKGHVFKTQTDSEILLHGYEEFGTSLLSHLRGMFSFVIWDRRQKVLFGARDYFGIKPFYYYHEGSKFVYGSEIKSILEYPSIIKELNEEMLEQYLTFQYAPGRETFFNRIFKLPPAHFFLFKNNKMEINRYWEPEFNAMPDTFESYVNKIDETIKNSIEAHKISDVEVGCFLSSGVDSSYVASCFNGDKTFTVGFDNEEYNEISYAQELSKELGVEHFSKIITPEEYWDILPKVQYFMDEPLADPSSVALYFVSQLASKHVKVVLSGEGADELFGGYNIYKEPIDTAKYRNVPRWIRVFLAKIAKALPFNFRGKNFLIRCSKSIEERFIGNAYIFSPEERKVLLKNPTLASLPQVLTKKFYSKVQNKDDVTKMQYLDIHMWLAGDILLKADKMSMAHSLELRVPFLDKEVCKVATSLPLEYRVNEENTKVAMRAAANRNMPAAVANKKKLGFPVPIRIWLKEDKYYDIVRDYFISNAAKRYFHTKNLVQLLDEHRLGKVDNSRKIWTVFMFLIWYNQYFETN
ncbi:asparagine synthase (glutamine-hydrolyzing) [Candidatus Epulonipiscium fishelsonii]|uniref:Asparagine synthase (Glutamine-hydrolyzing) n=1 Tax=Candidatus Epulonipiscium fishelsonii TaxID=77094 RepID=A0ACC8XII6_9FIRM|nr:asparagine synthase (glutamine-hydrolyzing) [Epulopiscium sp. SCG-D08WGA-EpuloA1]OON90816.1 MAG: asparagine synthase (glutamine-hydrolyzing) [Epulopiscium sp. AS2M-Bin002]